MKKWISLGLVVLLIIGIFVGCGKNGVITNSSLFSSGESYNSETLPEGIKALSARTVEDIDTADPRFDTVVATCGDYQLTNRVLQFYYWMAYLDFLSGISGYGVDVSMFGLDTTKPMSEQQSLAEGLSWEQYFLNSALNTFHNSASVAMAAKKAGFEMPEELQSYLDSIQENMETQAANYGYADALSFVQESFGPGATVESYREYVEQYYYSMYYENSIYDSLEYTDEELDAYYNENLDTFESAGATKDAGSLINVRHILITWEDEDGDGTPTDEEKAAAYAEAERILALYDEDPTEDHFAELANEYSTDPGSNTNGGLYEDVYPGQMVAAFNDWCFDTRNPGDTAIVETSYGYHIMYFVSESATPYWKYYALQNGFLNGKMDQLVSEMGKDYDINVDLSKIVIGTADIYGQ